MPPVDGRPAITCDTRQQEGKHRHVDAWFEAHGVPFSYACLPVGDYASTVLRVTVDTKSGIQELAANVGKDHRRFCEECRKAQEAGWKLVVLVEGVQKGSGLPTLARWMSDVCRRCGRCDPRKPGTKCSKFKRKPIQGATVAAIVSELSRKYGVEFEFCPRPATARTICDLLGVSYD